VDTIAGQDAVNVAVATGDANKESRMRDRASGS
jgi:hypothetical protein